jgi:hypothetical protein
MATAAHFPTGLVLSAAAIMALSAAAAPLAPRVEVEEEVYAFADPNNGSGPMWCSGSTCLVRAGDRVFASGIEVLKEAKPLNNCRWQLFERWDAGSGWQRIQADPKDRTREPSPLALGSGGQLYLSANPTLVADLLAYAGPARPEILRFSVTNPTQPFERILPAWKGAPAFTEHSYRSLAADGPAGELILLQNIGYAHAEWAFRDAAGQWAAQGQIRWPDGKDYAKPQPIRICYPNVALKFRAVYFCGVSDIVEPNPEWRAYKQQLTGREWDYDFRRLFYTWTPDITRTGFREWIEIASRERTCGWISPGDLWVGPDGIVHIIWTERVLDERLREKFFPEAKQSYEMNYARIRDGQIVMRKTLHQAGPGGEVPAAARFHITPGNRLLAVYYVSGASAAGKAVSENRLMEIHPDGRLGAPLRVPLKTPFTSYFTATPRGGSPPSAILDLLGHQAGKSQTISYARVRLP